MTREPDPLVTIRVSMETHDRIIRLAAEFGISPEALVERAVRKLERDQFWQQYNKRLKADAAA